MAGETRQERRKRERRQLDQKKKFDDAAANIPQHLKGRIGKVSKLSESIEAGISRYGWRGLKYTDDGEEIRSTRLGYDGSEAMKAKAEKRCQELRAKYFDWWGNKRRIRLIANKENISEKTIKRYFTRCPK